MIQHKVEDVKVGDKIVIIAGEEWRYGYDKYIGAVCIITNKSKGKAITNLIHAYNNSEPVYLYVDDKYWPFRLAPNGV